MYFALTLYPKKIEKYTEDWIHRGFFAYIGNIGKTVYARQGNFVEREMGRKQKQHEKNRTEHPNVQLVEHEHNTPLD